jgi:hypothetical protein
MWKSSVVSQFTLPLEDWRKAENDSVRIEAVTSRDSNWVPAEEYQSGAVLLNALAAEMEASTNLTPWSDVYHMLSESLCVYITQTQLPLFLPSSYTKSNSQLYENRSSHVSADSHHHTKYVKVPGFGGRTPFYKLNTWVWPPLWSSDQSSWLQIQRFGFDFRRYQIIWEVVGLQRHPFSLVSTIEELLGRKSSGSSLESREYGSRDQSRWPRDTLYPQKLALPSPTSGGRSVGILFFIIILLRYFI